MDFDESSEKCQQAPETADEFLGLSSAVLDSCPISESLWTAEYSSKRVLNWLNISGPEV